MIEFTRSFKTTDGNVFGTLELAQKHELAKLFEITIGDGKVMTPITAAEICLGHADVIVDLLTTTQKSKPRARAIHGGKKPRKVTLVPVGPAA